MTKLLFCDMDGTLIDENKEIHPKNIEMMRMWQKKHHKIALCTGRNIMECQTVLKQLNIPYDYLVLNNGGHILDKEKTLYEKKINHDVGCAILDMTTQFSGLWSYYCDGKDNYAYINGCTMDHSGSSNIEVDKDFKELYHQTGDFQIICFNQENREMDTTYYCLDYIRKQFPLDVEPHINLFYVDIVPPGCSKGEGVKTLLSLIDEKIDKTYAIGDSFNDMSMFKNVDVAGTFVYADREVQDHADKIVHYVYELLEYGLEEE